MGPGGSLGSQPADDGLPKAVSLFPIPFSIAASRWSAPCPPPHPCWPWSELPALRCFPCCSAFSPEGSSAFFRTPNRGPDPAASAVRPRGRANNSFRLCQRACTEGSSWRSARGAVCRFSSPPKPIASTTGLHHGSLTTVASRRRSWHPVAGAPCFPTAFPSSHDHPRKPHGAAASARRAGR